MLNDTLPVSPVEGSTAESRRHKVRVVKVSLHNVKSYAGPTTIDLAPGINAICGENGSGKSTILEAIGFALFGHRPYKVDAFLRDGEKNGSIAVTVEDEDGCVFDVVRKLRQGSGGGQAVYDELGARIAEGEADVRQWVRDFFRLDPGIDTANLFQDTVGPPQGTLTAIFLENPSTREKKFNQLLGLEGYKEAFDRLRDVLNLFKDEAADADRRAALLSGEIRRLPEVEERQAELVKRLAVLGQELQGLLARQEALAAERERLEKAMQALQVAQAQRSMAEARAREAERRRDELAVEMARAELAARALEESRGGYLAFQAATERLRILNARRQERDNLNQRAELAARTALQWEQKVLGCSEQLAALDRDAARAEELETLLPEQEKREAAVRDAEDRLRMADEARKQLAQAEERRKAATETLRQAEVRLTEAEQARPIASKLEELRSQERTLLETRASLEQQLRTLRERSDGLTESKGQLEQVLRKSGQIVQEAEGLRSLEGLAVQAPSLQKERDAAANLFSSLDARHKEATKTRSQVEGGLCPFFHEPCKNLRPGLSLDDHFDGVIAATAAETESVRLRLSSAETALAKARSAELAYSRLPELESQIEQLGEMRSRLEEDVRRLEQQRTQLAAIPGEQARVSTEIQALEPRLRAAEDALRIVSGEASWRSQAAEATRVLERERQAAEQLRAAIEAGTGTEEILGSVRASLAELGDPRGESAALRARIVRERPAVQRELERAQRDAASARAAEEITRRSLEPFAMLEQELQEATDEREVNQGDYNRFIANQTEAGRIEERRTAHGKAASEVERAGNALADAARAEEALRASYDDAAHSRVRLQLEEVGARLGGTRAEMELRGREEAQLEEELAVLRKTQREMEEIQAQAAQARQLRDTVEAIRRVLGDAGPEIGRALRRRISDRATSLYRELLGLPTVSLEWGDDYEIRCRIRTGDFEFKQLSGGEQMAAALAVRLALLQTISNLRLAFLDEPTAHMDSTRRFNLAAQIQGLRSFDQLVVISHDDSFDTLFGHVIRLSKRDGATVVEP